MNFMFERANDFLNLLHPDSCVSRRQPYFAVAAELYHTRVKSSPNSEAATKHHPWKSLPAAALNATHLLFIDRTSLSRYEDGMRKAVRRKRTA